MKVFQVQTDGHNRIVEAERFSDVPAIYCAGMNAEMGTDEYTEDDIESVTLISDDGVLRVSAHATIPPPDPQDAPGIPWWEDKPS